MSCSGEHSLAFQKQLLSMEFSYYILLEIHTRRFRANLILIRFRLMRALHEVLL